jgi:hypothetical protein
MKTTMLAALALSLAAPMAARSADGPPEQKKPKVITEDDLRRSRSNGTVSVGTPDAPAEKPAEAGDKKEGDKPKAEPTDEEQRAALRKSLQAEIDHHVANIAALQKQLDDAQKEMSDASTISYDQPGTSGRRTALQKLVDDATAQIQQSKDAIDQAEDKARRAGVSVSRP